MSERVGWDKLWFESEWPTPMHMRMAAEALDILTPAKYGDVLRHVADLIDEDSGRAPMEAEDE